MMNKVRIYEYITNKKSETERYRNQGCRAGMQRVVYEGTTKSKLQNILTYYNENRSGYRLSNYDVIEIINPNNIVVSRHYYYGNTFYPMNMYDYKPNPN